MKQLSFDCQMANTLHDNIVVKSKPKAPTEKEDKLTLLKHDCGQASGDIKSQPLHLVSHRGGRHNPEWIALHTKYNISFKFVFVR